MAAILRTMGAGSRATSFLLGSLVIAMAGAAAITSASAGDIIGWAGRVLGWGFVSLLAALVFTALFGWVRLTQEAAGPGADLWFQVGVQAANGVTTLALTFTLLGISLGIGSLAGKTLTPDTIQGVIQDMTANFSLAFMTTVIGLPVSALLRSCLVVTYTRKIGLDAADRPEALAGKESP